MEFLRVDHARMRRIGVELFESVGFSPELAATITDVQLEADLRGMYSHGFRAIPMYLDRVDRGIINPRPHIRVEETGRAAVIVHGDSGPGQAIAQRAMSECIAKAKASGFGLAVARNSNHLGAVGYYANMAVSHDLIGFSTTNGNVMLAPPGTSTPVVGNNPLAWAFPAEHEPPLCFDVATSIVAGGKIDLAAAQGEAIPLGWGIDAAGKVTADAKEASAGGLALPLGSPLAPYKGFGLALVLEVLAGVLSGARFGRQHSVEVDGSILPWDEGHFFLAFDPAMVMPIGTFKQRMDELIQDVRSVPAGVDGVQARVPGEAAHTRRAKALRDGMLLPSSIVHGIIRAVERRGTRSQVEAEPVKEG